MSTTIIHESRSEKGLGKLGWTVVLVLILFVGAGSYYFYKVLHLHPAKVSEGVPQLVLPLPKRPQTPMEAPPP